MEKFRNCVSKNEWVLGSKHSANTVFLRPSYLCTELTAGAEVEKVAVWLSRRCLSSPQLCSQKVEVDMEKLAAEMAAAEEAARRRAEEREREAAEQAEKAAQQAQQQQQQQQDAAGNKAAEQSGTNGGAANPTSGTKEEDKPTPMETGEKLSLKMVELEKK